MTEPQKGDPERETAQGTKAPGGAGPSDLVVGQSDHPWQVRTHWQRPRGAARRSG